MLKCDNCGDSPVYRVRIEKGIGYCDKCRKPSVSLTLGIKKMVKLDSMYVSEAQVKEQDRMRILPYNAPDGGHYVGRMGENGKISEREPDFRS